MIYVGEWETNILAAFIGIHLMSATISFYLLGDVKTLVKRNNPPAAHLPQDDEALDEAMNTEEGSNGELD